MRGESGLYERAVAMVDRASGCALVGVVIPGFSFDECQAEILACREGLGMAAMIKSSSPSIGGRAARREQSIGPPVTLRQLRKKGN
jgi:hypothetical protein